MELMTTATQWATLYVHLAAIFIAIRPCCAAGGDDSYSSNDGNNNNNKKQPEYYDTYSQPKYNNYGDYYNYGDEDKPPENLCYTCHFIVKNGHRQGFEKCRDPFDSDGIPQVACEGPCSKSYHKLGEKEYEIHRQCTPNCKEFTEDEYYVQCCSSRLCNGAQGSQARNHVTAHLVSIATAICLVLIFQLR